MNANQVILLTVILAGTTTLTAEYLQKKPVKYGRTITGALGMGFFLSLIATGSPDIAKQLSYVILISVILVNGTPILEAINKGVK